MVFSGLNILYYLLNRTTQVNEGIEQIGYRNQVKVFIEIEKFKDGYYLVHERENSIRNFSFRVFELNPQESIKKSLYFIKQVKAFNKINLLEIDAEARALVALNNNGMKDFIPTLLDSDFYNGCIIMNHIDGEVLQGYFVKSYRFIGFGIKIEDIWKSIFLRMSKILSVLHSIPVKQNFPEYTPAVFQLSEEFLTNIDKVRELNKDLVIDQNLPSKKAIQYLQGILPKLSQADYCKNAIIHRDAHFLNFIYNNAIEENKVAIKLVDWELIGIGDKFWDIAKIYSSLLDLHTDTTKTEFINEVIVLIWKEYHRESKIEREDKNILKVINFILYDSLERELNTMMEGGLLDENKIEEIHKSINNSNEISINGINLYNILAKS